MTTVAAKLVGKIPQFVVGVEYGRRDDIHLNYGGSRQSGISSSAVCPAIFLFTGDSGEQYGYRDGFDSAGVFSYCGEGQLGDMEFKAGNRAVRDHAQDGRALHLFESLGKGKRHKYIGEFVLANHSTRRGADRNGNDRNIIVFHLFPVGAELDQAADTSAPASPAPGSLAEARQRAVEACTGAQGLAGNAAVQTVYQRSRAVRTYVLMRANGRCEGCATPAPFVGLDGRPYLEAHHTTRLSDGGIDHPRHVAALCPTCHRNVHCGREGPKLNLRLVEWLTSRESPQLPS
ncbi:5-methylcytosine-specific restriction protein A [Rivibacter subsaxonicus]|uniref:5-methylcytosine-specific restriction protein A n=2 Tax=Rivibacter subsaxonicus TaxID=457575 RepID=A0A4Q7VAD7_9BURK|nr:5-methylcytosine-specific restriction protein A [Rivibacter subsaxonicus]